MMDIKKIPLHRIQPPPKEMTKLPINPYYLLVFYVFNFSLILNILWRIVQGHFLCVLLMIFYNFFAIDFISGLLHIVLDDYEKSKNYRLLEYKSLSFNYHHEYPLNMTRKHVSEVFYEFFFVGMPCTILTLIVHDCKSLKVTFALITQFFAGFTGMSHYYCHCTSSKTPNLIKLLQKLGIFLKPTTHKIHHSGYDKSFCIVNGSTNFIVDLMYKLPYSYYISLFGLIGYVTAFSMLLPFGHLVI